MIGQPSRSGEAYEIELTAHEAEGFDAASRSEQRTLIERIAAAAHVPVVLVWGPDGQLLCGYDVRERRLVAA